MPRSHVAVLAGLLFAIAHCSPKAHGRDDPDVEKEVQKILGATQARELLGTSDVSKGYQDLFRRIGPDGIRKLKDHKNHGAALRAAWEEIRATIPENPDKLGVPVDADALERFLGFVKGRVPAPVPRWWQRTLLSAKANRRDNVYFSGSQADMYEATRPGIMTKPGIMAKPGVHVTTRDGKPLLTVGDEAIVFPESIVHNTARGHLSVGLGPKNVFLAVHSIFPSGYPLYCVKRPSGDFAWKSKVWADGGRTFYTGLHSHNVTVIADEKHVTVFGGSFSMLYVESFNAENGAVLYRFCTWY